MEKNENFEYYKETLEMKPMSFVGKGNSKEERYYIKERCGIVIMDQEGIVKKIIPNIPGEPHPKKFQYAGPYMLIGNTVYYNDNKTKYRCDDMYYEDELLECIKEENGMYTSFFLVNGKALKRAFFRTLYSGQGFDLISKLDKNEVVRLRVGSINKTKWYYGKKGKLNFHRRGPIAWALKRKMTKKFK